MSGSEATISGNWGFSTRYLGLEQKTKTEVDLQPEVEHGNPKYVTT